MHLVDVLLLCVILSPYSSTESSGALGSGDLDDWRRRSSRPGENIKTVRFYQRTGLGLRFIRLAQGLGFSLAERKLEVMKVTSRARACVPRPQGVTLVFHHRIAAVATRL